jgi:hypothetical protein
VKHRTLEEPIAGRSLIFRCGGVGVNVSVAALFTVVVLVGCGNGLATQSPSAVTNAGAHTSASRSWMDPKATAENLLYVSTFPFQAVPDVEVYSWERRELVGTLMGFQSPQHLCADKAGNIFVPDADASRIFEYAHGGTSPIATLHDALHAPHACSVDGVTGDLAVVDAGTSGDIAIYRNASGNPTRHYDTHFTKYDFCGYDDAGNLFVDGTNHLDRFRFAEIPKGRKFLTGVNLDADIITPGSVQWDGKYMALGDEVGSSVYQFAITGSTGTEKGRTDLEGGDGPVRQFWIPRFARGHVNPQGRHIVATQFHFSRFDFGDVGYWGYPAGGAATHFIVGPDHPLGVTVSISPK